MAKILLIEPDRQLAQTYYEALQTEGHTVIAAAGAQTAILATDQEQPDLIILEPQLVEHSGIEFLYELRSYSEWQLTPVIIQTIIPPAEFNDAAETLRTQLGVNRFLYKPQTNLKQLLRAVDEELPIRA